jgi:hypothetical protein
MKLTNENQWKLFTTLLGLMKFFPEKTTQELLSSIIADDAPQPPIFLDLQELVAPR